MLSNHVEDSYDLFTGETVPRGVAYLSLGLPTAGGDWTMRAAMSVA